MPNYIEIDRNQMRMSVVDIEGLVPATHPARAIWALSDRLDLSGFAGQMNNDEGGRRCWPPRLLFCVWVYGYSRGIASARSLTRMMEYEPGLRWLCGDQEINYHTLADFRTGQRAQLEELMSQLMAILDKEQLIDLQTITQDGTKIRAAASKFSFHRMRTIRDRLKVARKVVRELTLRAAAEDEPADERVRAAERRVAQEQLQRLESSWRKLKAEEEKVSPSKRPEVRVSTSEPQARKMKQADGGWAPSYNVQISTDAKHRMIVGVRVTEAAADSQQLQAGMAVVRKWCGRKPERVLADGGYASRDNVEVMANQKIEFVAPWKDSASRQAGACRRAGRDAAFGTSAFQISEESLVCPAGKTLQVIGEGKHHGQPIRKYEAQAEDCAGCAMRDACCGRRRGPRQVEVVQETEVMQTYLERMQKPEIKDLYKKRSEVAEFPNLWIKAHWGMRRFTLRGKAKVAKEAIWAALAYNIQQWTRLKWSPTAA